LEQVQKVPNKVPKDNQQPQHPIEEQALFGMHSKVQESKGLWCERFQDLQDVERPQAIQVSATAIADA
jgi:hypothetical protein